MRAEISSGGVAHVRGVADEQRAAFVEKRDADTSK